MDSPIVIHKSAVGLLLILIVGAVFEALLLVGLAYAIRQGQTLGDGEPKLLLLGIGLVLLGTGVQGYVYLLSKIVFTAESMTVVNWTSLVQSRTAVTEWKNIVDCDVQKGGLISMVFDVGTLYVQTAGTERNLKLSYIGDPERWRGYISKQADAAVTPVRETAA